LLGHASIPYLRLCIAQLVDRASTGRRVETFRGLDGRDRCVDLFGRHQTVGGYVRHDWLRPGNGGNQDGERDR
jgi:hypothetical protein